MTGRREESDLSEGDDLTDDELKVLRLLDISAGSVRLDRARALRATAASR